jgi:hypothetical protein
MSYTIIYNQQEEINGITYQIQHYPGSVERLVAAHPDHDVYVYQPEIVGLPVNNEETGEIEPPTRTRPSTWTPVDPVPAILVPRAQA